MQTNTVSSGVAAGANIVQAMEVLGDTAGGQMDPRRVARNAPHAERGNRHRTGRWHHRVPLRVRAARLQSTHPLRRDRYEAVRLNARRFVIAPGHAVTELEHEVERHAE